MIFIDGSSDTDLRYDCLFEINPGQLNISSIIDTSGNGNKGILFGDYSIRKNTKEMPLVRQTTIDYPEVETEDGAL